MTVEEQTKPFDAEHVDLGWQPEPLREDWPEGQDTGFILMRMEEEFESSSIGPGGPGRLLDVACGNAYHAPAMHRAGWEVHGLEPSTEMIVRAHELAAREGTSITITRAIGETMPYKDETFDRVVCMSSLDHFANPDVGLREMARVLKPGGELVIGIVNYGGLGCRLSRLNYKIRRALRLVPKGKRLFWDDPTEGEHTFEGSIKSVTSFGRGSVVLTGARGVSMFWAVPGWNWVLNAVPGNNPIARKYRGSILRGLDWLARRTPSQSDFLVLTFRRA
jgi:SAM-dependent methyltransferase